MAITILANPQDLNPAYNPMYFYFDSTAKAQLGFRYVVEVVNSDTTETIGTYRLKPIPNTLYGEVDISELIQKTLYNDFRLLNSYVPTGHQVTYELNIDEEYYVNVAFTDYGFAGASTWADFSTPSVNPNGFTRTMLACGASLPPYVAGDQILVIQIPSANYRPELDGIHTVLDVFFDTGVYYVVLDLLWIGSGAASGGSTSYADGQKTTVTGVNSGGFKAFKGAFKFMDFKDYDYTDYELQNGSSKFLTTLPNGVRISRAVNTWLAGYVSSGFSEYVVFNINNSLYRYSLGAVDNEVVLFKIVPLDNLITEKWDGTAWVAFTSTIDLTSVESYTVQINTAADVGLSKKISINLYSECDKFTTYDITFLDRFGSWVTVPFNKGSYMSQEVERNNLRAKYGGYDSGEWVYTAQSTGSKTYHVEEDITYTVNTGILSEVECQYYRELISTPQAFVSIDGGEPQAIEIITASMPLHLKRTQRDRKVSLQFKMSVQDEING